MATLGLLGREFTPEEYAQALGHYLGITVVIAEYPDVSSALMRGEILKEGHLAEVVYNANRNEAVFLVRESLKHYPWPTYELQLYHELSHIVAGHPLEIRGDGRVMEMIKSLGVRLAQRPPRMDSTEERHVLQEEEAKKRAKWLILAATWPDIFATEDTNRLT